MYWLLSSEDFYLRLENTYSDPESLRSNSWLCSLHSLVALCVSGMPASDELSHSQLAYTSLESATLYASRVTDEADLDSTRALVLLALALQSNGYLNSAYLQIGTAARIAVSLGLHLDKYSPSDSLVSKAYARRLWWTLFLFDHDISLQMGKPCMSGSSEVCHWQPPLPSEQIVSPGSFTPHDYLGCCVSLAQLTTEIRHKLDNNDQSHDSCTEPLQSLSDLPEPISDDFRMSVQQHATEDWNLLTSFDFFDVTTDKDFMDQLMEISGSFSHEV
ncbi:hypothetical protein B0J15DRAFT_543821 [Fusarium solani]|uniref:Xylanolytic transcriptional activator regulatory domain-containing protein n=1 Tax=Fusarium solani TaxID=169388 RepID=A0A9P9KY19_FUSSL|nr:uncharacterized protein B0J15DRAFT_543821 [Fusarium solani]KAH7270900.1 hypothetical protein B0J15DRAFT_543821 [Fusarium solani]